MTHVINAGAYGGASTISPGSWIEIYGSNLAVGTRVWSSADFNGVNAPTSLGGTSVTIGGQAAFADYVSSGQVNVQVPSGVGNNTQPVVVTTAAGSSTAFGVNVAATSPGLLAPPAPSTGSPPGFNVAGTQYVVALLPDGTYVLPPGAISGINSRRANPGDTITLYGIGFGPVTPAIAAGQIEQQTNQVSSPLSIAFGNTPATTIAYSGLAPNYVGLYQFNVVVPNVAASDQVPLTFSLGGAGGSQTLYIAVQ
ncbi:MAG TPA: IPT/TIG domain-containing protein [Bryobacteraceae bacterium]